MLHAMTAGFWRQWRAFVARRSWSASATWIPATGEPTCKAARSSNTGCCGWSALASLMAIFMQVISARLGVVDRQRPGPMLPRLVSRVDALAQLADERSWPSAPAIWPKCWAAPWPSTCCSIFHFLGRHHHRLGRAAAAGHAAVRHAHHRSHRAAAGRDHRRLLLHRDFRPAADAAQLSGDGPGA